MKITEVEGLYLFFVLCEGITKKARLEGDISTVDCVGCVHNHEEKTRREMDIYGICMVIMFRDSLLSCISLQST